MNLETLHVHVHPVDVFPLLTDTHVDQEPLLAPQHDGLKLGRREEHGMLRPGRDREVFALDRAIDRLRSVIDDHVRGKRLRATDTEYERGAAGANELVATFVAMPQSAFEVKIVDRLDPCLRKLTECRNLVRLLLRR